MGAGLSFGFSIGLVGFSVSLDVSSFSISFGVLLLSVVSSFGSFEIPDEFLFDVPDSSFLSDSPKLGFPFPSLVSGSLVLLIPVSLFAVFV